MIEKLNVLTKSKFSSLAPKDTMYHFFLFEEILLFCREVKKQRGSGTGFKFKGIIPLRMIAIKEQATDFGQSDGKCL
jgi:hypothetical protein